MPKARRVRSLLFELMIAVDELIVSSRAQAERQRAPVRVPSNRCRKHLKVIDGGKRE